MMLFEPENFDETYVVFDEEEIIDGLPNKVKGVKATEDDLRRTKKQVSHEPQRP